MAAAIIYRGPLTFGVISVSTSYLCSGQATHRHKLKLVCVTVLRSGMLGSSGLLLTCCAVPHQGLTVLLPQPGVLAQGTCMQTRKHFTIFSTINTLHI